jgi:hypothetical protein
MFIITGNLLKIGVFWKVSVIGQAVLKDCSGFVFSVKQSKIKMLQNVRDCSTNDTMSHPRRAKSLAALLQEPRITYCKAVLFARDTLLCVLQGHRCR